MAEKRNIFLVGPMGAGKSTIGRQLAQQLNMEFYDSDQEIEKRTGADVGWVFDVEGEDGFRDREEKVINELTENRVLCWQLAVALLNHVKHVTVFPRVASWSILKRQLKTTCANSTRQETPTAAGRITASRSSGSVG